MTLKCKDFAVLVRYDNPPGTAADWFVLSRFSSAAAALACLNAQRDAGKTVRIGRL